LGNIWSRRLAIPGETVVADSLRPSFSEEQFTSFAFVLAYEEGTVNDNQLLFEIARYNFTKFMVRNFDITTSKHGDIAMLHVKGLRSFAEAYQYMLHLYDDSVMAEKLEGLRAILISEENLEILFKHYSIDEYVRFYEENFIENSYPGVPRETLDEIFLE
jgi:hypothetical protein